MCPDLGREGWETALCVRIPDCAGRGKSFVRLGSRRERVKRLFLFVWVWAPLG